jgi:hypothetical protein
MNRHMDEKAGTLAAGRPARQHRASVNHLTVPQAPSQRPEDTLAEIQRALRTEGAIDNIAKNFFDLKRCEWLACNLESHPIQTSAQSILSVPLSLNTSPLKRIARSTFCCRACPCVVLGRDLPCRSVPTVSMRAKCPQSAMSAPSVDSLSQYAIHVL